MAARDGKSLEEIKATIQKAAAQLAALSPENERVSWLIEDALMLLDEPSDEISVEEILEREFGSEYVQLNARNS